MRTKFCRRCGAHTARRKDGTCRFCAAKRLVLARKKIVIETKQWQPPNPDKTVALARWQAANSERLTAADEWRAARGKEWYEDTLRKGVVHSQNRRARILNAGGIHTAEDICAILSYQNNQCACCAINIEDGYHVDHIEPLSKGGSNDRRNLQLLCEKCNTRKNAKHPIKFMKAAFPGRIKEWARMLLRRREVLGF